MLEDAICPKIASIGAGAVTAFYVDLPDPQRYLLPSPLRLPDCFWTMTAVQYMSLQGVIVSGVPGGPTDDPLARLPFSLVSLNIYDSHLVNPVLGGTTYKPNWAGVFSSKNVMASLLLENVRLESTIPSTVPNTLTSLSLTNNSLLTGTIPSTLFSHYTTSQKDLYMDFSHSGLTGTIPSDLFTSIHGEINSIQFAVADNSITGSYPENFLTGVSWPNCYFAYINVSSNKLNGSLPYSILPAVPWVPSFSLTLGLADNNISGSIPSTLLADSTATIGSLLFDCSQNQLTGSIPSLFAGVAPAFRADDVSLQFGSNRLSGSLISADLWPPISMDTSTIRLGYSSNLLTGDVPADLLVYANSQLAILELDAANNQLTGTIASGMISIATFDVPVEIKLNFANNGISGPLETALIAPGAAKCNRLFLDLSSNPLGGNIPSDLLASYVSPNPQFSVLSLRFNNCSLSGTLPNMLVNMQSLIFSADNNQLDAIPDSWASFICDAVQRLEYGFELSIASNSFTGEFALPSFASPGSVMASFNLYGNDFTALNVGAETRYLLDFNIGMNRRLTGSLPSAWFDDISYIEHLIASNTSLSGTFPDVSGIVNSGLQVLDLSNTAIDFCPPWTSAWEAEVLDYCDLKGTNASDCIDFFPALCKSAPIEPVATPVEAPIAVPTSIPSAPTAAPTTAPFTVEAPTPAPIAPPQASPTVITPPVVVVPAPKANSIALAINFAMLAAMLLAHVAL